ncbi:MAG: hypothetical protein JSV96_06840 [Candidatus Aminicenantes bacterium]|nr:MAG: hypothetical protein JSV96_06840 [Candidatus Aminicenantes bacterium]
MRFKIQSFIFVFIVCFLVFSYIPMQGEMQEDPQNRRVFFGAELNEKMQKGLISRIEGLGELYKKGKFKKIGDFYKETGVLTRDDLQMIKGSDKITKYFKLLSERNVESVTFTADYVYADKLKGITVSDLLETGVIQEKYIPAGVTLEKKVTHAARAQISYSFTLKGKKYNSLGSWWGGFHIDSCPWL